MFKGFQIQANGEVVPCCVDWKRINILGGINQNSVKEVWDNKRLRLLRMVHLLGGRQYLDPCKTCTMNDFNEIDNIDADAEAILKRL